MSRSLKKGPYVDYKLYRKAIRARDINDMRPIRTWARASTIIPEFIGLVFEVHNGKSFIKVSVTEDMVGHKLGEFSLTRAFRGHAGQKRRVR